MNLLEKIQTGKRPAPRRVMLYGTHGVGKSTFGAMSDKPIFLQTEDGLGEIDCHKYPLALTFDNIMTALAELYTEKHPYRTVVVDSLDWLERLIWAQVCQNRGLENIEDIPYGKAYMFSLTQWREFLEGLMALRDHRGMTVILIAHAKIEKFDNPETESYDRYSPRLHKLASSVVQEWCDEVLFATYKIYTKKLDAGFSQTRTQGIGSGERILRTSERPAHIAKNRLNLPDEIPLDWNEFVKYTIAPATSAAGNTKDKGK